ncbi:MAG TPA: glycoside hydrolase family 125 protein, partial [Deinococcales bacterium]|nr:glycoside hydrolase family 125 protein [Deinococcales bacterium]
DPWTGGLVLEPLSDVPLAALGLRAELDGLEVPEPAWQAGPAQGGPGEVLRARLSARAELPAGATASLRVYLGLGLEADSARTTALHLRRVGWPALLDRTLAWLAARQADAGPLSRLAGRNRLFSHFFAQADALDTGEPVMLTSRSPRYYVSGAYWARDSLLWAFESVLQLDLERAADLAAVAVNRYARLGPGEHAQHLNGTVLYPGFELDEAAAPFAALAAVTQALLAAGQVDRAADLNLECLKGLRDLARVIESHRHPAVPLHRTFLSPTDDPVTLPYLTYDNALLASALTRYGQALELLARRAPGRLPRDAGAAYAARGSRVRETLLASAPAGGRYPFAFSPDRPGLEEWGDAPAGSLLLLPDLGVTSVLDPAWQATAAWIRGPQNPHSYGGAFPGRGSAHFPHPSVSGLVNDLRAGFTAEALAALEKAPLDDGLACESYSPDTGEAATGGHFATLAGWLGATLVRLHQAGRLV